MSESSIRHYLPETDLSALARMLTEIEFVDRDGEDASEEYLRNSLTWPNYHPAQDAWVAELEGKLVGYGAALGQPSQRCTIYVVIHPSQRRKGLGSQLLALTLDRARKVGSKNLLVYANEHNSASDLFLKHHEFQQVGSSGAMKLNNGLENSQVEFPRGFTLKKYSEVNDPILLLKALNICCQGMWGHGHNDNPTEDEQKSPRFLKYYDAEDILLLFDEKDAIFGICSLKSQGKQDDNGELSDLLDGPGILQEFRDQGYQRPFILAGIRHLQQKGSRPVVLEFWGDNENALNIYRSLGFEMMNRFVAYHRELA